MPARSESCALRFFVLLSLISTLIYGQRILVMSPNCIVAVDAHTGRPLTDSPCLYSNQTSSYLPGGELIGPSSTAVVSAEHNKFMILGPEQSIRATSLFDFGPNSVYEQPVALDGYPPFLAVASQDYLFYASVTKNIIYKLNISDFSEWQGHRLAIQESSNGRIKQLEHNATHLFVMCFGVEVFGRVVIVDKENMTLAGSLDYGWISCTNVALHQTSLYYNTDSTVVIQLSLLTEQKATFCRERLACVPSPCSQSEYDVADLRTIEGRLWLTASSSPSTGKSVPLLTIYDLDSETPSVLSVPLTQGLNNLTFSSATSLLLLPDANNTSILPPRTIPALSRIPSQIEPTTAPLTSSLSPTTDPNLGIGIGIAAFFVVVFVLAIVVWVIHRRKKTRSQTLPFSSVELGTLPNGKPDIGVYDRTLTSPIEQSNTKPRVSCVGSPPPQEEEDGEFPGPDVELDLPPANSIEAWHLPFGELGFDRRLGRGSFGVVYKGRWRQQKVAIKMARVVNTRTRREFMEETRLMIALRPHGNVIQVFGVTQNADTMYIVMELAHSSLERLTYTSSRKLDLSASELIRIAHGVASGMNHLSREKIVHRDLAARNVLLDKHNKPKISDFGMSRRLLEPQGETQSSLGPIRWMAPECITRHYSAKSDVWAFGCVLYEMCAGGQPYSDRAVTLPQLASQIRDHGLKPTIPEAAPQILKDLMADCWKQNPEDRPSFDAIASRLKEALTDRASAAATI